MTDIATILRQEVHRERVISFARFMEIALYCPEIGYYERSEAAVGKGGDFYTNVSVGRLYGELLAFQFAAWIEEMDRQSVHLIEAGAHDGRLAHDILVWLRELRPKLFPRIAYWIIEPSERRQAWQRATLEEFAGRTKWCRSLEDLPPTTAEGVIFSNELLDAFPVHLLRWDALERRWREWGVGLKGGELAWERMPADPDSWHSHLGASGLVVPPELAARLPDGFTVEISPQAARWWHTAATRLRSGRLMTVDYGGEAEELLSPHRAGGTLRGYVNHHVSGDVLFSPGDQDLTAHVNFSHLRAVGEAAGLKSQPLLSQPAFLSRIFERTLAPNAGFSPWTPGRTRQFQTLTHPEHLGRSFRVLIQSRAV